MSSTRKKVLFLFSLIVAFGLLGFAYVLLSGVKNQQPDNNIPSSVLLNQNLIPGESTKEDVLRLKGKPDITSELSGLELLKYSVGEAGFEDMVGLSSSSVYFYLEHKIKPQSFPEYSKKFGQGIEYFEEDDAIVWHVYASKGVGVAVADDEIVKILRFPAMNNESFKNDVGFLLGLSKEVLHEEPILEP